MGSMITKVAEFIAFAGIGLLIATLVMWGCAQLARVPGAGLGSSLCAAAGFGLPLAGAASLLLAQPSPASLMVLVGAVVVGLVVIRVAYRTTWGKAAMTWVMNVCVGILLSSLMLRAQQ